MKVAESDVRMKVLVMKDSKNKVIPAHVINTKCSVDVGHTVRRLEPDIVCLGCNRVTLRRVVLATYDAHAPTTVGLALVGLKQAQRHRETSRISPNSSSEPPLSNRLG